MKVDFKQNVKVATKKIADTAREVGEATIKYTKKATQKVDEFVKSKDSLKKVTKEHVIGAGVLVAAVSLAVACIKGLTSSIDEEVKK